MPKTWSVIRDWSPCLLCRILHLFPWSGIVDDECELSDTFRVPDPQTGQMRRLTSQIPPKEEEMFRNMIRRLNYIVKVRTKFYDNRSATDKKLHILDRWRAWRENHDRCWANVLPTRNLPNHPRNDAQIQLQESNCVQHVSMLSKRHVQRGEVYL